jgi:hypothetical protein
MKQIIQDTIQQFPARFFNVVYFKSFRILYLLLPVQWNLWIATLWNEDIMWNKDTLSGPELLFSVQIALWNEDTSQLGTLLACQKGVLISQVSLY